MTNLYEPRGSKTIAKIYATGKARLRDGKLGPGVWNEGHDGWWAVLKDGWQMDHCSQVHFCHEDTLTELLKAVREAVRCDEGCPCGHGEATS